MDCSLLFVVASNGIDEFYDSVAVFLGQFAEFLHGAAGVALGVAVPHDGFDDGLGAAVVQTVATASADFRQATTPQRRGAAPTRADVVHHVELVLDVVAVRPNLLVGIAWQTCIAVLEEACRVGEHIVASLS